VVVALVLAEAGEVLGVPAHHLEARQLVAAVQLHQDCVLIPPNHQVLEVAGLVANRLQPSTEPQEEPKAFQVRIS